MPPTTLLALHPSPKRKRDQPPPPVPLINTALHAQTAATPPRGSPTPDDGPDSPRNEVAEQLRGMTLTSVGAVPMSPLSPTDGVVRKKPKLENMRVDSVISLDAVSAAKSEKGSQKMVNEDTPAANMKSADSDDAPEAKTQPRTSSATLSFARSTPFVSSSTTALAQPSDGTSQRSQSKGRNSQPRQRKKSPSPPLPVLTWQDSEITGHLAGPSTDPDDDGTGLNGIGFRPTPAIAYARAQKRRQQVLDWKTREAREARAKRTERRRRGVGGMTSREATVEREVPAVEGIAARRTVKFAI